MRKSNRPFRLTEADRKILEIAPQDPQLWAKWYFDIDLQPWQEYFLLAPQTDKLVVAGIRTGKSFISALGFLWFGQLHPQARILNTSISSEQANIVFQNCLTFCENPRFKPWVEDIVRHPYPAIRLVTGAEMWFRSIGYEAELIRGFEFDLINIDEAAYVVREMAVKTLKGRLLGINPLTHQSRAGLFWMISTPKGKGWLFDRWKQGDPRYTGSKPDKFLSLRVLTYDNRMLMQSERGQELTEQIRQEYSERLIRQELEAEFLDDEEAVFPYEHILYACNEIHPEVQWLNQRITEWRSQHKIQATMISDTGSEDIVHYELEPESGHEYLQSWDMGKRPTPSGRNAMVGQVWDLTDRPFKLVGFRYAPGATYGLAHQWVKEWHWKYNSNGASAETLIDATGKGDVLNERLEEEDHIEVDGVIYSAVQKPALIHAGQLALERNYVRFPFIRRFVDQLHNYELMDKKIPQDLVMAFCQAMHRARQRFGDYHKPRAIEKAIISSFRRPESDHSRFVQRRKSARTRRIG